MANRNRGEIKVELEGKEYTLRPSFKAICEMEDRLDKGLPEMLVRISERKRFGMKELAAIFHAGLLGQKDAPSFEEMGELLLKSKVAALQNPAYSFLGELWYQGQPEEEAKEEKKPEAQA